MSIIFTILILIYANETIPRSAIIENKKVFKVEKATLSGEGVSVLYNTDYVKCTKFCGVYVKSNRNEIEMVKETQKGLWDWFILDSNYNVYYGEIK